MSVKKDYQKKKDVGSLAKQTEGLVGAEIASISQKASLLAIREFLGSNGFGKLTTREKNLKNLTIEKKHFVEAMKNGTTNH